MLAFAAATTFVLITLSREAYGRPSASADRSIARLVRDAEPLNVRGLTHCVRERVRRFGSQRVNVTIAWDCIGLGIQLCNLQGMAHCREGILPCYYCLTSVFNSAHVALSSVCGQLNEDMLGSLKHCLRDYIIPSNCSVCFEGPQDSSLPADVSGCHPCLFAPIQWSSRVHHGHDQPPWNPYRRFIIADSDSAIDDQSGSATDAPPQSPPETEESCIVRINEFNTDTIDSLSTSTGTFIELSLTCPQSLVGKHSFSWTEYKVVIIRGGKVGNERPQAYLVFLMNFKSIKKQDISDTESYFVLGGQALPADKVTVRLSSAHYFPSNPAANIASSSRGPTAATKQAALTSFFERKVIKKALPAGVFFPHAILLLKIKSGERTPDQTSYTQLLTPSVAQREIPVSDRIAGILRRSVVDGVMYGRNCPSKSCGILEDLVPAWKGSDATVRGKNRILRDWEPQDGSEDRSLSRCGQLTPFHTPAFKSSIPTPMEPNQCSDAYQWYLEDVDDKLKLPTILPLDTSDSAGDPMDQTLVLSPTSSQDQLSCSGAPSSSVGIYEDDSEISLNFRTSTRRHSDLEMPTVDSRQAPLDENDAAIAVAMQQSISGASDIVIDDTSQESSSKGSKRQHSAEGSDAGSQPSRKKPNPEPTSVSHLVTTTDGFNPDWPEWLRDNIGQSFRGVENIWSFDKSRKEWLVLEPNEQNPLKSVLKCRICSTLIDRIPVDKYVHQMKIQEHGWYAGTPIDKYKSLNSIKNALSKHKKDAVVHLNIVKALNEEHAVQLRAESANLLANPSKGLAATANMMRLVYTEQILNVPFVQHKTLVNALDIMGLNIGNIHRSRYAVVAMAQHISKKFHQKMIQCIMQSNAPITIILDGSTDNVGNHFVAVFFRTVVETKDTITLATFFYKLVQIDSDESAQGQLEKILEQLTIDSPPGQNFKQHFFTHLTGWTSDGAAVNLGEKAGMAIKFQEHKQEITGSRGNILTMHCMAHRLELAIKRAWGKMLWLEQVQDTIHSAHRFFNNLGSKRKSLLREVTVVLDEVFFELHYVFQQRWIASSNTNLKRTVKIFRSMVTALERISDDEQSWPKADVRQKARGIAEHLKSRSLLLHIHFAMDVSDILASVSKRYQENKGVIIGQDKLFRSMLRRLEEVKEKNGPNLIAFLDSAKCGEDAETATAGCTIEEIETSTHVEWKEHIITEPGHRRELSFTPTTYIDQLTHWIREKLDENLMRQTAFLDVTYMPETLDDSANYGQDEIRFLSEQLNVEFLTTWEEWQQLLQPMIESREYKRAQRDTMAPRKFWLKAMRPEMKLPFGRNIKWVIQSVLAIGVSSAQCERAFSFLNWRKTDRRSRLSGKNLDALLRIHINGPPPSQFDSAKYAKSWLAEKRLKSDSSVTSKEEVGAKDIEVIKITDNLSINESVDPPIETCTEVDPDIPPIF